MPPPEILHGEMFALHQGKGEDLQGFITLMFADGLREADAFTGVFATCRLDRVVRAADEVPCDQHRWFEGPYGWVLKDLFLFDPIPCRGQQRLWTVPPDVLAKMPAFKECRDDEP
jgi:hypothetical protein